MSKQNSKSLIKTLPGMGGSAVEPGSINDSMNPSTIHDVLYQRFGIRNLVVKSDKLKVSKVPVQPSIDLNDYNTRESLQALKAKILAGRQRGGGISVRMEMFQAGILGGLVALAGLVFYIAVIMQNV